ncbi:MAG: PIG-L family deacetylase, partial [bacterium]
KESSKRFTLLAVHAHPDDESSGTGGLIAACGRAGHTVVLVTCTNGEWGEVKDKRLGALRPRERAEDRRRLAEVRLGELDRAAKILGIAHLHPLGYQDSGMAGWESTSDPAAFANADLEEVTGRLVRLIREHRPDVLVTYNENGGYGHPDHLMAHRAAMAAVEAAEDPDRFPETGPAPWRIRKIYYTAWSRTRMLRAWRWMRLLGRKTPLDDPDFKRGRFGTPDEDITTRIDVRPVLRRKWRALFSHRSQMAGNFFWWFFRLSGRWLYAEETFVCARSDAPLEGVETSVFEGL